MYSVVLMMALSNGAGTPAQDASFAPTTHTTGHYAYRGGRGGCCGCNGGGHGCCGCNGGRGGRGHGCCGNNHGCCGQSACCNTCCGDGHHATPAPAPAPAKMPAKAALNADESAASATIVVNLPADAALKVDDQVVESRTLVTPALDQGREFHYTLTAEIVRDGETLTATKEVAVRAGEETQVSIDFTTATVAQR